jgi:hypothetical protein
MSGVAVFLAATFLATAFVFVFGYLGSPYFSRKNLTTTNANT